MSASISQQLDSLRHEAFSMERDFSRMQERLITLDQHRCDICAKWFDRQSMRPGGMTRGELCVKCDARIQEGNL